MEYTSKLKAEKERCIKKLSRYGFERENLEFRDKRHGTQQDEMARCAIAFKVAKKAEALKMSYYDAASVLGCGYSHVMSCRFKGREAETGDNYPYLKWVLWLLK